MVKRLFFYLLACLLACLLLLLLLEGVLRFIVRPDNPFLSYASARQFAAQPGIFAPGDSAFQRGPERMPFRYSVNNLGFRGSLKAQRGEKILLLGDSVAFGLFLNDTDTLAQQIQHLSQGGLTVLNSGVGGWGPEEQFAWLKDKLPMLRVDRVLWLITTNDPMDGLSGDNHYQKVNSAYRTGAATTCGWNKPLYTRFYVPPSGSAPRNSTKSGSSPYKKRNPGSRPTAVSTPIPIQWNLCAAL